ncbi:MAG: hypothetical protein ACE5ES_03555 [Candidatus Nanoarchaeia archaeon]
MNKCICGNHNYHSKACKHRRRLDYLNQKNKERRKRLRAEHRCIWCKKKVKPVITYPQFCEAHSQKNRKSKLKEKFEE